MGLNESTKGNRTYVSIVQGQFAQRVPEGTPKAVKRIIEDKITKAKREVWELLYGTVDGMINSIEVDESGDFGDQLKINMADGGKNFTVSLSMTGREAKSFLCVLTNVDLKDPVTLAPYNFESKENGKQVIGMNTYQGGKTKEFKAQPYFSKDTPNGLPQVPESSDKDEFKIVMKQQEIFLKKWVKKFIEANFADAPQPSNRMQGNPNAENATPIEQAYSGGTSDKRDKKIYGTVPSNPDLDQLPF